MSTYSNELRPTLKSSAGEVWSRHGDLIVLAICAQSDAQDDASGGRPGIGRYKMKSNEWSVERDGRADELKWMSKVSYLAEESN